MKLALITSAAALACGVVALVGCQSRVEEGVGQSSQANTAVCTEVEQTLRWDVMVVQPILVPNRVGGLDLANGTLSFQAAEKQLCFSALLGDDGFNQSFAAWGHNQEIIVGYDTSKPEQPITYAQINPGYFGSVDFISRPGSRFGLHSYSIRAGQQITRDGAPFEVTWGNPFVSNDIATELYDALMWTFAPTEAGDQVDCVASEACQLSPDGTGGGAFGARALHFYLQFDGIGDSQPKPSTPAFLYLTFNQ